MYLKRPNEKCCFHFWHNLRRQFPTTSAIHKNNHKTYSTCLLNLIKTKEKNIMINLISLCLKS